MENLQTVWHYARSSWDIATPFLILFLGVWIGIRIGKKWGKEEGTKKERARMWRCVESRLGEPRKFIFALAKNGKGPIPVQGTMELNPPTLESLENGLPFEFKFKPDPKQWKPGPCC